MNDFERAIACLGKGAERGRNSGERRPTPPGTTEPAAPPSPEQVATYKLRQAEARLEEILSSRSWRLATALQRFFRLLPTRLAFRARLSAGAKKAPPTGPIPRRLPEQYVPRARGCDIIVPVYNGYEYVVRLVGSLRCSLPLLEFPARCILVDDCSTDPLLETFYQNDGFFQRPDVVLVRRPENKGFVASVNAGLALADRERDVLVCNSDIELHPQALDALRDVAARHESVASVTPLTNNGTIASLFDWPRGAGMAPEAVRELALCVASLGLETPLVPAPTGVGFCMYVTREALNVVGIFDEETYSLGYGEENDWCRRAVGRGFTHLVCTQAFVPHYETKSFDQEQKAGLIRRNHEILKRRFPDYFPEVEAYVEADPLRDHRGLILLRLALSRLSRLGGAPFVLMALHNDPACYYGGTERHAWLMGRELERRGLTTFFLYPVGHGDMEIFQQQTGERFLLREDNLPWLAELFQDAQAVHVHHLAGLEALEALLPRMKPPVLLTVHDFYLLCPRSNCVTDAGVYCLGREQAKTCTTDAPRCSGRDWNPETLAERLGPFSRILFPSENARREFTRRGGLEAEGAHAELAARMEVSPHFLPYAELASRQEQWPPPKRELLVFLGYVNPHKGGALLRELDAAADSLPLRLEIWGHAPRPMKNMVLRPFEDWRELQALALSHAPGAVLLPSIWPETFSYTLYEALFLLRAPLIVGPLGNPAEQVAAHGLGVVMERVDKAGFDAALARLQREYERYLENVRAFVARHAEAFTPEKRVADYLGLLRRENVSRKAEA